MLSMVLSTVEFIFVLEYFPGVKNVIADFGSRFIDPSEWDEPIEDDPLEINELYNFEALIKFPTFNIADFSTLENEKIQRLAPNSHKVENEQLSIMVRGIWYILVPEICQRAVFWYYHFPRHLGVSKVVGLIKAAGYWWFEMTDTLLDFL